VFDVRFLPNPNYVEGLRELTGAELGRVAGGQLNPFPYYVALGEAERAAMGGFQAAATAAESEATRARLIEEGLLRRA